MFDTGSIARESVMLFSWLNHNCTYIYFTSCCTVSIVDFEHVNVNCELIVPIPLFLSKELRTWLLRFKLFTESSELTRKPMQNRTTQVELLSALLKSILFLFLQTSVWYCSYRENGTKGKLCKSVCVYEKI